MAGILLCYSRRSLNPRYLPTSTNHLLPFFNSLAYSPHFTALPPFDDTIYAILFTINPLSISICSIIAAHPKKKKPSTLLAWRLVTRLGRHTPFRRLSFTCGFQVRGDFFLNLRNTFPPHKERRRLPLSILDFLLEGR